MMQTQESPEYCRQRARDALQIAQDGNGPGTRDDWLEIAHRWETLAAKAEAKEKSRN